MKIAAIGCSFTNYIWPTYADLLQADRYGLSGIGNDRIWYILSHLNKTSQLHLYDAVLIQWTSPYRFDYLTSKGWTYNDGNIAYSAANSHIWKKIKEWYNEDYETERSENMIVAAKALLDKAGVKHFHMSMTHLEDFVDLSNLSYKYPGKYHFNSAPWSKKPFRDGHPTVKDHMDIAETISKHIDYNIDPLMIKKCNKIHKKIISGIDFKTAEDLYNSNFPYRHITAGF